MPFRPIALADKKLFELARAENPTDSCEQTFAVNFAYSDNYNTQIAVWNGRVAVYKPKHKILHYPIGTDTEPLQLIEYVKFAESGGATFDYIYDAPPDYAEKFPDAAEFFDILQSDGDADYIYNTEDLRELKGAILRKKRNHIKHFRGNRRRKHRRSPRICRRPRRRFRRVGNAKGVRKFRRRGIFGHNIEERSPTNCRACRFCKNFRHNGGHCLREIGKIRARRGSNARKS